MADTDDVLSEGMAKVVHTQSDEWLVETTALALVDLTKIDGEIIEALRPLMERRRRVECILEIVNDERQRRREEDS